MGAGSIDTLTVREIIYGSGLGIELAGGSRGLDRSVEAVHISENEDAVQWISPGTLLLTTGAGFASDLPVGVRLLHQLSEAGMSGLLISLGPHLQAVPSVMAAEAEACGFPLLIGPINMPLRFVTSYVNDALASHELHRLKRNLTLQNELVSFLSGADGDKRIVARLAGLLDVAVVLFERSGSVKATAHLETFTTNPDSLTSQIWRRARDFSDTTTPGGSFQLGGHLVVYHELPFNATNNGALAVIHRDTVATIPEFEADTLAFAERLLAVWATSGWQVRDQTDEVFGVCSEPLDDLIRGSWTLHSAEIAAKCGISFANPWRVVIVSSKSESSGRQKDPRISRDLALVSSYFVRLGVQCLSTEVEQTVVLLAFVQEQELALGERDFYMGLMTWTTEQSGSEVYFGLSERQARIEDFATAYSHASQALDCSMRKSSTVRISFYEDVRLTCWILDLLSNEALQVLKERIVDPLIAYDQRRHGNLYDTLLAYVACGGSPSRTTEALFLHRNSLRYRLTKIERILDLDLENLADWPDIYLGLMAAEVLAARTKSRVDSSTAR